MPLTMGGHVSPSLSLSLFPSVIGCIMGLEAMSIMDMAQCASRERERQREQNATAASGNNMKRLRRRKTTLCPRREEGGREEKRAKERKV